MRVGWTQYGGHQYDEAQCEVQQQQQQQQSSNSSFIITIMIMSSETDNVNMIHQTSSTLIDEQTRKQQRAAIRAVKQQRIQLEAAQRRLNNVSADDKNSSEQQFYSDGSGSAVYGNFHNYYNFNPAEERLQFLPKHFLQTIIHNQIKHKVSNNCSLSHEANQPLIPAVFSCLSEELSELVLKGPLLNNSDCSGISVSTLDIGCNEGDITFNLLKKFQSEEKEINYYAVGVDIDPILIKRAREKDAACGNINIQFFASDLTDLPTVDYLANYPHNGVYDVVLALSVTMWIHLHHGDEGLKQFLRSLAKLSNNLLIEPQPFHCYKSCVARWRAAKLPSDPPHYKSITWRRNVSDEIINFLENDSECSLSLVSVLGDTKWKRRVCWFQRKIQSPQV
jgi:SAM-dependent methyltransferase